MEANETFSFAKMRFPLYKLFNNCQCKFQSFLHFLKGLTNNQTSEKNRYNMN